MRLRLITEVDFRKSEQTNFDEVQAKEKLRLDGDDVICLVNRGKTQAVFVWKPYVLDLAGMGGRREGTAEVMRSTRLRLRSSTWSPLMIQNYANEVGIHLDGLRRFEEIFSGAPMTGSRRRAV